MIKTNDFVALVNIKHIDKRYAKENATKIELEVKNSLLYTLLYIHYMKHNILLAQLMQHWVALKVKLRKLIKNHEITTPLISKF